VTGRSLTRIRLTRKYANRLNGVDLSNRRAGDIFDLRSDEASVLIDAGWAELWVEPPHPRSRDARNRPPSGRSRS
jgi:hypothetical protein